MSRLSFPLLALLLLLAAPLPAVQFDHEGHQQYVERCADCHVEGARRITPEPAVCLECHDREFIAGVTFSGLNTHDPTWALTHRPFAKGHTYDCSACHPQRDCQQCHQAGFADEMGYLGNHLLNVHRSDFHVTHPIAARTDPQLCASCHREKEFCRQCHDRFQRHDLIGVSHQRGWRNIPATARLIHEQFSETDCQTCHTSGAILPSHQWSSGHAREARQNLAVCQTCHADGDVCLRCHSARTGLRVNPHPSDWGDKKNRLDAAGGGTTCRRCH